MGLRKVSDNVTENLTKMISNGRSPEAFLMRVVYPEYKKAQRKRFMTENGSEGSQWEQVDPKYAARKQKQYSGWVGNGKKTGIRTGRLLSGILGNIEGFSGMVKDGSKDHRMSINGSTMIVGVQSEYAGYFDEVRPIMQFRKEFIQDLKNRWVDWIVKGSSNGE